MQLSTNSRLTGHIDFIKALVGLTPGVATLCAIMK